MTLAHRVADRATQAEVNMEMTESAVKRFLCYYVS